MPCVSWKLFALSVCNVNKFFNISEALYRKKFHWIDPKQIWETFVELWAVLCLKFSLLVCWFNPFFRADLSPTLVSSCFILWTDNRLIKISWPLSLNLYCRRLCRPPFMTMLTDLAIFHFTIKTCLTKRIWIHSRRDLPKTINTWLFLKETEQYNHYFHHSEWTETKMSWIKHSIILTLPYGKYEKHLFPHTLKDQM